MWLKLTALHQIKNKLVSFLKCWLNAFFACKDTSFDHIVFIKPDDFRLILEGIHPGNKTTSNSTNVMFQLCGQFTRKDERLSLRRSQMHRCRNYHSDLCTLNLNTAKCVEANWPLTSDSTGHRFKSAPLYWLLPSVERGMEGAVTNWVSNSVHIGKLAPGMMHDCNLSITG